MSMLSMLNWLTQGNPLGAGARLTVVDRKIDHDLGRQPLERLAQFVELEPVGDAEARGRAKHLDAGKRLAFETAYELFNVDAEAGERLRHVAHDARPLVADDLQRDKARRFFGLRCSAALDRDAQARRRELPKRGLERAEVFVRNSPGHPPPHVPPHP